jgi:quinoprotein glucose dehydrogenase
MPLFSSSFFSGRPVARMIRLFCALISVTVLSFALNSAGAEDFKQPEPLEPDVAEASEEAAESMSTIRIPAGWQIDLFAAEPDVANVVAMDVDHRGRVFVCESFRQNRGVTDNRGHNEQWLLADLAAETVQDRIDYHKRLLGEAAITYAQHDDRIRRLDDVDGDGTADKSYLVANGFNRLEEGTGAGVLVRGDTIYFTNIPKLWKLTDQDDDGTADERVALSDGYGVRVAFRGHDMHGLVIGPDGRLYFSIGDRGYHVTTDDGRVLANPESGAVFRCELDGSGLEVFAMGLRNPQELAFNDVGDLFSVDNNSDSGDMARVVHILQGSDAGWRMHYQYLPDRGPFNRDKLWEPFHPEQPAYIVPPVTNFTDGPSGLAYYPGTGFGDALRDTFLICDFRGGPANSGIRSFQLNPDGAFYSFGEDSDPIWNVLATDVAFGPDGALYVSDWVDGWNGLGKARIYRLTDPDHAGSPLVKDVQELLASNWTQRAREDLVGDLAHRDRRVRFEAQWELARRGEAELLISAATNDQASSVERLHAIWGIDQIVRTDPDADSRLLQAIGKMLDCPDTTLRAAAAKVVGERQDSSASSKLKSMLSDDGPRVRYFATLSLAQLKDASALDSVVALLSENDNSDPALRHAGIVFLASVDDHAKVAALKSHANASVRRAAVVALRRQRSNAIREFLSDTDPLVVLEAARAIHDVPIPVATGELANMIEGELEHPELIRRVLNSNYRVGTPESASKLAAFCARFSAPPEMRIEALDMLGDWGNPDPRDRVLGVYRPLKKRSAKIAADALSSHIDALMTAEDAVREKAIETAAGLGLTKIVPMLMERVKNVDQRPSLRANALRALARLAPTQAVAMAKKVSLVPATTLVPAALDVLGRLDPQGSITRFVEATGSRDMRVRQLAWDILAAIDHPKATETIVAGVNQYLDGSLPTDAQLNVIEAAEGKVGDDLKEAIAARARTLAEADSLGPWLASLAGGDADRGAKIFHEKTDVSCLRCHKIDRAGGEVGPDLTVIGKQRDRRYLLESICLPDAQIAKGYETAVVADGFGKVYTGIVKSENDDYVELIQNDGSQQRIDLDDIDARRKGKSSMPADLLKSLSARELRDLVAYLASLQIDPRAEEETE